MEREEENLWKETKETLRKQLQLLFEQSQNCKDNQGELATLSFAMAEIAKTIMYPIWCEEVSRASRRFADISKKPFVPTDSSGAKYSAKSSSITRPLDSHEQSQGINLEGINHYLKKRP